MAKIEHFTTYRSENENFFERKIHKHPNFRVVGVDTKFRGEISQTPCFVVPRTWNPNQWRATFTPTGPFVTTDLAPEETLKNKTLHIDSSSPGEQKRWRVVFRGDVVFPSISRGFDSYHEHMPTFDPSQLVWSLSVLNKNGLKNSTFGRGATLINDVPTESFVFVAKTWKM